jgi:hypothetical protein
MKTSVAELNADEYERECSRLQRFMKRAESGCIEWIGARYDNGYGACGFLGRTRRVHQVVMELATCADIPFGTIVRHKCKMKTCVNEDHLELGTRSQNEQDKVRDGTDCRGEKHANSKLTNTQAQQIFEKKGKIAAIHLAREYSVSRSVIYGVWNGWQFSSVTGATKRKVVKKLPRNKCTPEAIAYISKAKKRFKQHVKLSGGHWLWKQARVDGYSAMFAFNRQTLHAHQAAWMMYNNCLIFPKGMHVRHIGPGCPRHCCNPEHLAIGTPIDNANDKKNAAGR